MHFIFYKHNALGQFHDKTDKTVTYVSLFFAITFFRRHENFSNFQLLFKKIIFISGSSFKVLHACCKKLSQKFKLTYVTEFMELTIVTFYSYFRPVELTYFLWGGKRKVYQFLLKADTATTEILPQKGWIKFDIWLLWKPVKATEIFYSKGRVTFYTLTLW